jgi:hypothetical protein
VKPPVAARLAAAEIFMAKQVAYGDATTISHATGISLREVLLIARRARAILEP